MNWTKRLFGVLSLTLVCALAQAHHPTGAPELGTGAALDKEGRLWLVSKETSGASQYIALQTSSDLGKTWSPPKRVNASPERIAANGEARPHIAFGKNGEIYISYSKSVAPPHIGDIRFIRSIDGGRTFSSPITVHTDHQVIAHSFESMLVDSEGRIYVTWIDGRDRARAKADGKPYAGNALYYAVSNDGGASFQGDIKVADHSCECCRIALALNAQGRPVALWRHVFQPNVRDHALVELTANGTVGEMTRATFDDWRVDACPHHGPGLAYGPDGRRHQVWFNVKEGDGGVFYAAADASGKLGAVQRLGTARAEHADVAVRGHDVALVWKEFDGKASTVKGRLSHDDGQSWKDMTLVQTEGASDEPRLLNTDAGIILVWRTEHDGVRTIVLGKE